MIKNKTVRKILRYVLITPAAIVVILWFGNLTYHLIMNPLEGVICIIITIIIAIMLIIGALMVD
ncbi:MAG: hypothetical protein KAS66_07510 [Candidatus Omnitrophica bacterium]|nr:hypothetical protein [Candidatus Omnitrophota bacterium]